MKILHVLYAGLGGHGNVFFSLRQADKKNLYEYQALFNGVEPVREEYRENCNRYGIAFDYVGKHPGLDLKYYSELLSHIKKSNAEVVLLHSSAYVLPAWIARLFSKKKPLLVVRETQANHLKSKAEWFWLSVALVLTDKIVFLSTEYRDEIKKKLGFFFNEKKVSLIPNGIDLEKYFPAEKLFSSTVVIGMQSRLVPIKDHLTLLESVSMVLKDGYDIKLIIAGDGGFRPELEKRVTELGITNAVTFTGMLDEKYLVDFIQSLDIYVHASLGETMSTAIMQAMACKMPIVASDVDGISNMINNNETGLLVPAKDAVKLKDALEILINDSDLSARLSGNAHRYAINHFSNETMFEKYSLLFNQYTGTSNKIKR